MSTFPKLRRDGNRARVMAPVTRVHTVPGGSPIRVPSITHDTIRSNCYLGGFAEVSTIKVFEGDVESSKFRVRGRRSEATAFNIAVLVVAYEILVDAAYFQRKDLQGVSR